MNFFTVAIYVLLDDIFKAVEHKEDPQRKVNDALVLTTLLLDDCAWEVCRKKNTRRGDIYQIMLWKKAMRRRVESYFSAITDLFPHSIHAVTANGFLIKCFVFVFVYGLHKWLA